MHLSDLCSGYTAWADNPFTSCPAFVGLDALGRPDETLRHWASGMMEENERLRAEMGDAEGLVRALRRRERRRADRLENGSAREQEEAAS